MQGFFMLDLVLKYWVFILAFLGAYGAILRLCWKVNTINKDRFMCESRCSKRVDELQSEYNDDLKEMRADVKEIGKVTQSMNLSITALTSFLQGKGVTP